jgi:hypothetical protein
MRILSYVTSLKLVAVFCILINLISCKKEHASNPDDAIHGSWKVNEYLENNDYDENHNYSLMRYLTFDKHENVYYKMFENEIGFRSLQMDTFLISSDYVEWFDDIAYSYEISHDELILKYRGRPVFVCEKNDDILDPDAWVAPAEIIDDFEIPQEIAAVDYDFSADDESLWFSSSVTMGKYQHRFVNPDFGSGGNKLILSQSLAMSEYTSALEIAGDYLWYAELSDKRLRKRPYFDINPVTTSIELIDGIRGIAYDGRYLWVNGAEASGTLYKYDPEKDVISKKIEMGDAESFTGYLEGMTFHDDRFYVLAWNCIHVCTFEPFTIHAIYGFPENYILSGIAHDGAHLWVLCRDTQAPNPLGFYIPNVVLQVEIPEN